MNEIGRPLTSVRPTSFQSSSVVFSTMAQPCRNGALLVVEHQAIAGFPDRRFLDVADADRPLALAEEVERDGLLVVRFAGGQHDERLPQLVVELFVLELDAADAVERRRCAGRRR